MKGIITIVLILVSSFGITQKKPDYTGTYQGIITQPIGGLDNTYAFWLKIEQKKDSIFGLSRLELSNSNNYGIIEFKGKITGNSFVIQETKITAENIVHGSFWCIKAYTLLLDPKTNSLSGEWTSTKTCGPGMIYVYKSNLPFNKDKIAKAEIISNDEYKKMLEDGVNCLGKKTILENLIIDKWAPSPETGLVLDEWIALLKKKNTLSIKLSSYTDNEGNDSLNLVRSLHQVEGINAYLVSKGIKQNRIFYEAFGEARPLRDNGTENGRKKNRRVEMEVYEKVSEK